jgi:hypothetical protein
LTRTPGGKSFTGSRLPRRNIMKADTFARLVVLETLIDAEIGHFL